MYTCVDIPISVYKSITISSYCMLGH